MLYFHHNIIIICRKRQNEKDFLGIPMEGAEEEIREYAEKQEKKRSTKKGKSKKMLSDIGEKRGILRK